MYYLENVNVVTDVWRRKKGKKIVKEKSYKLVATPKFMNQIRKTQLEALKDEHVNEERIVINKKLQYKTLSKLILDMDTYGDMAMGISEIGFWVKRISRAIPFTLRKKYTSYEFSLKKRVMSLRSVTPFRQKKKNKKSFYC